MKSRPVYESDEILQKELDFIKDLEAKFDMKLLKLGKLSELDCIISLKGRAYAFAEMKVRNIKSTDYPTLFLPETKLKVFLRLTRLLAVPKLVAFYRLLDGDFSYTFNKNKPETMNIKVRGAGRTENVRDEFEIQPCLQIPVSKCVRLK